MYRAQAGIEPVSAASLNTAIEIMRKRVARLGVTPEIQSSGADKIVVGLPDVSNAARAREEVGKTAQLYFYDWEPNVIGPNRKPSTEMTAINALNPGASANGLTEYHAVLRAAQQPAILRARDTTWTPGCTAAQIRGCRYGSWYLLDTKHEQVLCGPEDTKHSLYAGDCEAPVGRSVPVGIVPKAVRVEPGTVLVRALPVESDSGKIINQSPNSWFVLNDDPVFTGADITNSQQSFDEIFGARQPNVTFGFTSYGKTVFERLTKEVARRGLEAQLPGVAKEAAEQHFAVVLDGQLITVPSIDFTKYPEGIDASNGSQISGAFTALSAGNLANELRYGALPIKLTLISGSHLLAG